MNSFKPLRIIQIGTGAMVHAAPIADAVRRMPEFYRHLGLVETDEQQKRNSSREGAFRDLPFFTWEEALSLKPDAFLVETDELRLVPAAIRVLEAGFPVFMDKPGSGSAADFHRMCRIAEEKALPFFPGYMYRGNPAIRKALELVRSGQLGRVVSFEGQMSCMREAEYHRTLQRFSGGMMYYLGCHIIDLMVQFCGFPAQVVPMNMATHACGVECCDHGFCVFRYPETFAFVKTSASEHNGFARRCISVAGTRGALEIRPLETPEADGFFSVELRVTLNNDKPYAENSECIRFPLFRRYETMMADFARCVRGEQKPLFPPMYEAKLHDLILAAQSAPSEK